MKRLLFALTVMAASVASAGYKTLMIIDASSSMRGTDPQNIRRVAAELYIDLAQEGDQISVMEFDAKVRPRSQGFVEIKDAASRDKLKAAARAITSDGDWTDFGAAFSEAAQVFSTKPEENERRILLFMTDGHCDPAPDERAYLHEGERLQDLINLRKQERELRCQAAVIGRIKQALSNVGVVAVGLSAGAPKAFLDQIAQTAGGKALVTEKAEELPGLFAQIHAANSGAKILPLKGKTVVVDDQATRLQVVVTGDQPKINFTRPDLSQVKDGDKGFYAAKHEKYQAYEIRNPGKGTWSIDSPKPIPPGALIAYESFNVRVGMEFPGAALYGSEITPKVWMTIGDATTVAAPEFSDLHQFFLDVTDSAGKSTTYELTKQADKRYGTNIKMDKLGNWKMVARIEPGSNGSIQRKSPPRSMTVVAPLVAEVEPMVLLNNLMAGEPREVAVDLQALKFSTEDLTLKLQLKGVPAKVTPEQVTIARGQTTAKVQFEAWDGAKGDFSGFLTLEPKTEPYNVGIVPQVAVKGSVKSSKAVIIGLGVLALILAAVGGLYMMKKRNVPSV
ncbi:MAG: VWA domain-containing protein [Myxococcaceae bacterium]|nr:VWA domain-containing protein [Myxococcaceae bacterium]